MWEVEFTDQFEEWWISLTEDQQDALHAGVVRLEQYGPSLGRPVVDHIKMSRHANMKELRTSQGGSLRVLFAFDPERNAILLLGGDKTGRWKDWYATTIPVADDLFDDHLTTIAHEKDNSNGQELPKPR
jgi:hypothetical protein